MDLRFEKDLTAVSITSQPKTEPGRGRWPATASFRDPGGEHIFRRPSVISRLACAGPASLPIDTGTGTVRSFEIF
jgi:hypothetical protein